MLGRGHNLSLLLLGCLVVFPLMEATNPCKLFTKKFTFYKKNSVHSIIQPIIHIIFLAIVIFDHCILSDFIKHQKHA